MWASINVPRKALSGLPKGIALVSAGEATWKPSAIGREAKFHRLTSKGRAQLEEDTANWAPLSEAIRLVLRTAQQGT